MYLRINNFIILALFLLTFLFTEQALAQSKNKSRDRDVEMEQFLEGSEFAIQRRMLKDEILGQKGLVNSQEQGNLDTFMVSDVIDPFFKKTFTSEIDYIKLDDGIKEEEIEEESFSAIELYSEKISSVMSELEQKIDVDYVDLLNRMKIDKIVYSPETFVSIRGEKFREGEHIDLKFHNKATKEEFIRSINTIHIKPSNSEEANEIEKMKQDAISRYEEITSYGSSFSNIVRVEVKKIRSQEVEFSIKNKSYVVKMRS